jgi:Homeodomain-like domain
MAIPFVMNELRMELRQSIISLSAKGWSQRRIARELCLDRETVARYRRLEQEKEAKPANLPAGSEEAKPAIPPAGSSEAKPAIVPAGSGVGKIEAGVKFVQSNALAGRVFESLSAQNLFLTHWEETVADTRTTRQQVRAHFLEIEKPRLQPLPASLFRVFQEAPRRVHRDGHVEIARTFYSVPPEYGPARQTPSHPSDPLSPTTKVTPAHELPATP